VSHHGRVSIRDFFYFFLKRKKIHVAGNDYATCQTNRDCFQFSPSIYNFDSI